MFEFSRKTLFSLEKRLSKHKITVSLKFCGGAWTLSPPPPGYAYVEAGGITGLHRHFLQLH